MPMGTLAQWSLTTYCSMLKTLYTFKPHAHAFGTQCSPKTLMFQPVFFTNHKIIISTPSGNKTHQILFKSPMDIRISNHFKHQITQLLYQHQHAIKLFQLIQITLFIHAPFHKHHPF